MTSFRGRYALVLLVALAGLSWATLALAAKPKEVHVKDTSSKDGKVWSLDFKFVDPRLMPVKIPGRGQRVCWYLRYQVINNTGEPRSFVPDFELYTRDTFMSYKDQVLPSAQEAIQKFEDPENFYKIKNSVTIAADPIPVTLPKATPRAVTGVAIWTDPNEPLPDDDEATKKRKAKLPKLAETNSFTIFVGGLSNGWSKADVPGSKDKFVVQRKTLELRFKRAGDAAVLKSEAIRFEPPARWIYRATSLQLDAKEKKETPPAKDAKKVK
jgi:hypothetical protein